MSQIVHSQVTVGGVGAGGVGAGAGVGVDVGAGAGVGVGAKPSTLLANSSTLLVERVSKSLIKFSEVTYGTRGGLV
jgi:hypothetical protein